VLQQHARYLGADMGLVTHVSNVRRDAEGFGIPVFDSTAAAQRDAWPARRPTSRRDERRVLAKLRPMQAEARAKEAGWRSLPAARIGFFTLGVLAVLAVAGLFLPQAEIKLTPASRQQSIILPVTASESIDSVLITGSVPAHELTFDVTGTQAATIISKLSIPQEKSKGVARFTNLTQLSVTVPAGTVIYSAGQTTVRFVTLNETHLDGKVNSFVEVPIAAVEPGEAGNLPANSIQAIEGNLGLSASVNNPAPTSGGSDRVAVAPSEDDRKRVRDVLLPLLQAKAQQQAGTETGGMDVLLANTVKMAQVLEETYDPPAGAAGTLLTLTMRVEYSAQFVNAVDLTQLAEAALNASMPAGFVPARETLTFHLSGSPVLDEAGASHFDLQVERQVLRQVDTSRANALVRGLSPEAAAHVLQSELALSEAPELHLSPSWWPWLPLIPFRISIQ